MQPEQALGWLALLTLVVLNASTGGFGVLDDFSALCIFVVIALSL